MDNSRQIHDVPTQVNTKDLRGMGQAPRSGAAPVHRKSLGIATELPTPPLKMTGFHADFETGELIRKGKSPDKEIIEDLRSYRFALQEEASLLLYNYYEGGAPTYKKKVDGIERIYEKHHRTCTCNRFLTGNTAQVLYSREHKKASIGGTMCCANSRTCLVCGQKINIRKANEMRQGFNEAIAQGLHVSMLTFTAPHNAGDSLVELIGSNLEGHCKTIVDSDGLRKAISDVSNVALGELDDKTNTVLDEILPKKKAKAKKKRVKKTGILGALSDFWTGNSCTKFKKKYGILGNIRSFEVRYGVHGWHPHFHIIIFSEKPLPLTKRIKNTSYMQPEAKQDKAWLSILNRWRNLCVKNGLSEPSKYGMDIQQGGKADGYITKFGSDNELLETRDKKKITWDMADEMTKGNMKTGKKGSLTPWDFLDIIKENEDLVISSGSGKNGDVILKRITVNDAKDKFLEYARAMYRVNLIKWSKYLRRDLGMNEEKSDQEILEEEEASCDILCHLTPSEWRFIYFNRDKALLYQLAENGGRKAVALYIYQKMYVGDWDDFYYAFINRDKDYSGLDDFSQIGDTHVFHNGKRTLKIRKRLVKPRKNYLNIEYQKSC